MQIPRVPRASACCYVLSPGQGVLLLCAIDLLTSAFQVTTNGRAGIFIPIHERGGVRNAQYVPQALVACTMALDLQYVQSVSGMTLVSSRKRWLILAGVRRHLPRFPCVCPVEQHRSHGR